MEKKGKVADSGALYYASLAILAEQAGNYGDAGDQWLKASETCSKPDAMLLYKEAAMRCERRAKEKMGKADDNHL